MARGRLLVRSRATDPTWFRYALEFGPWAVVFADRLTAFLDCNGNVSADPIWLKANVMPLHTEVSMDDVKGYVSGLYAGELAELYEVGGKPYLHFPTFIEEQTNLRRNRESPEWPVPEGFDTVACALPEVFVRPAMYFPAMHEHGPQPAGVQVVASAEQMLGYFNPIARRRLSAPPVRLTNSIEIPQPLDAATLPSASGNMPDTSGTLPDVSGLREVKRSKEKHPPYAPLAGGVSGGAGAPSPEDAPPQKRTPGRRRAETRITGNEPMTDAFTLVWRECWLGARGHATNPKRQAWVNWQKRLAEGEVTEGQLREATERYVRGMRGTRAWGTEKIMQAATFYGPEKRPYLDYIGEDGEALEAAGKAAQRAAEERGAVRPYGERPKPAGSIAALFDDAATDRFAEALE